MRNMTDAQREAARNWVAEQRRLLAERDNEAPVPEYALDDDEAIDPSEMRWPKDSGGKPGA